MPAGQFQLLLDIVSYIQFVTEETVSTAKLQIDKVYA